MYMKLHAASEAGEPAQQEKREATALVRAAQQGDTGAFYRLMEGQKEKLYRMALSFLKNEPDALEAIQETTCRAYLKLGQLRDPAFFGTWVMRILMNYCRKELRRQARHTAIEMEPEGEMAVDSDGSGRLSLEMALEQLEPRERQIVMLKFFEDWTIRDIAKALRCPDSTVKTRLYRALKGLRRILRNGEGDGQ